MISFDPNVMNWTITSNPFTVDEVSLGSTILKAKNIHSFVPTLSEDKEFFVVEFEPWGIIFKFKVL